MLAGLLERQAVSASASIMAWEAPLLPIGLLMFVSKSP